MASVAARSWGRYWSPAACRWPPSPGRAGRNLCDLDRGRRHLRALSWTATGTIAPDWRLGLVCGLGGLLGGYVGAWLQPWLPERALRLLLGLLAIGLASLYIIQAIR